MPKSIYSTSVSSHSHSASSEDSFCLSSNYCTSVSDAQEQGPTDSLPEVGIKPTDNCSEISDSRSPFANTVEFSPQPPLFKQASLLSNPTNAIYSFDWTNSTVASSEDFAPDNPLFDLTKMNPDPNEQGQVDQRCVPPTLPPPTLWSTFTHKDTFAAYIAAQGLDSENPAPFLTTEPVRAPKAELELNKNYANMQLITDSNYAPHRIYHNCSWHWVTDVLLCDANLPVPFKSNLISSCSDVWNRSGPPGRSNFRNLPDLADAIETESWLNYLGNTFGDLHGLIECSKPSEDPDAPGRVNLKALGDRSFDCEGSDKPLDKGLLKRKPDIVVIDRRFRDHVDKSVRMGWPLVQALIEISSDPRRSYTATVKNYLQKAANVFEAQLHRRYILGFVLLGKAPDITFYFIYVDRVGAIITQPVLLVDFNSFNFARVIFALTFGNDSLLGMDIFVTFDRFTGKPQSVTVGGQNFRIITQIFVSPYLFSRGTRVYIVADDNGQFHILKDSWVLSDHTSSEIDNIKKISRMVETSPNLPPSFRALCPRFVAGDDKIYCTDDPRNQLSSLCVGRTRRRIVTGPIGDPITSYSSRVELLQSFIDITQRRFLHSSMYFNVANASFNRTRFHIQHVWSSPWRCFHKQYRHR